MINDTTTRVIYNGDGITKEFPFSFPITDKKGIKVVISNIDNIEIVLNKDYFVDEKKHVVFYPGYAPGEEPAQADIPPLLQEGEKIAIIRETKINQTSTFGRKWPFYIGELGLDKLTMISQELKQLLGRALLIGDTEDESVRNLKLPIGKPNTVLGWDGTGKRIINLPNLLNPFRSSYKNVKDMKKDWSLYPGKNVATEGYYSTGDRGGATYIIDFKKTGDVIDDGAVIRLNNGLVARLVEPIHAKTFGAKADGISDDSSVIKALIEFCVKKKIAVRFPEGTYLIKNTLEFNGSANLELENKAIIVHDTKTCMFRFNEDNCSITGGVFKSSKETDENVSDIYGLIEFKGENSRVHNCHFINVNKANIMVYYGKTTSIFIDGCIFEGNFPWETKGVTNNYDDGGNVTTVNNQCYAVWIGTDTNFKGATVRNCKFDGYIEGVYEGEYVSGVEYGVSVTGCMFTHIVDHCCYLNGGNGHNICGNTCYYCQVPFAVRGDNCLIDSNVIRLNCEVPDKPEFWKQTTGISCRSTTNLVISNNVIRGKVQENGSVIAIINLKNSPVTELHDIKIMNNIVEVEGSGNITIGSLGRTTDIYNIAIENNLFKVNGRPNQPIITGVNDIVFRNVSISGNYFAVFESNHQVIGINMNKYAIRNNRINLMMPSKASGTTKVVSGIQKTTNGVIEGNHVQVEKGYGGNESIVMYETKDGENTIIRNNTVNTNGQNFTLFSAGSEPISQSGNVINGKGSEEIFTRAGGKKSYSIMSDTPLKKTTTGTNCTIFDYGNIYLITVDSKVEVNSGSVGKEIASLPSGFTLSRRIFVNLDYASTANSNYPVYGLAELTENGKFMAKSGTGTIQRTVGTITIPKSLFTSA